MKRKRLFPKLMFGGVILVAIGIATFGFLTFKDSLDAMKRASQENISWSATQLERELTRFQESLGTDRAGTSSSTVDINQRFDVLWSRVAVFQRGKVGARLRVYDTANIVGRLFAELRRQEVAVVSISSFDFTTLASISRAFRPYGMALHELSRRITVGEEEKAAGIRAQMRESANYALYASVLTVFLVAGALVYFVHEGAQFRKLAGENDLLAKKFKAASEVKSRFLTMMSHELRTPMNGVLGLLSVARDSEQDPDQMALLNQVDRSANRMLDMLTDILDFAALEDATNGISEKPFFSHELLLALPELLGPVAAQASATLRVVSEGELPIMMCGDASRLRRSYALIVTYFLETAGAQSIDVKLSYNNGMLRAVILVNYVGGGWNPDLVFGDRAESEEQFGAGALGPSVARALVAKMGGTLELEAPEGKEIAVSIEVPVGSLSPKPLKILLDLGSGSMEIICKSAVSGLPVEFFEGTTNEVVDAVWLESGKDDENKRILRLRAHYPEAKFFGIGRAVNPEAFDFVVDLPAESVLLESYVRQLLW